MCSMEKSDYENRNQSSFKTIILSGSDYAVSRWAGGSSSQIFIYPENSIFNEHTFLWRISTASLEADSSTFTCFGGYHRILHLLTGESQLHFGDGRLYTLHPDDEVSFKGSDFVQSYGQASDLNLIMADGVWGETNTLKWKSAACWERSIPYGGDAGKCQCVLYIAEGTVKIAEKILHAGDSIVLADLDTSESRSFSLELCPLSESVKAIECTIYWQEPPKSQ